MARRRGDPHVQEGLCLVMEVFYNHHRIGGDGSYPHLSYFYYSVVFLSHHLDLDCLVDLIDDLEDRNHPLHRRSPLQHRLHQIHLGVIQNRLHHHLPLRTLAVTFDQRVAWNSADRYFLMLQIDLVVLKQPM